MVKMYFFYDKVKNQILHYVDGHQSLDYMDTTNRCAGQLGTVPRCPRNSSLGHDSLALRHYDLSEFYQIFLRSTSL